MRSNPVIVVAIGLLVSGFFGFSSHICLAETSPSQNQSEQIQQLIQRLGAKRFATRQRAEAELRYLGPEAVDQLLEAQYDSNYEISLAARQILNNLTVNWSRPDEHPITENILQNYDDLSEEQRISRANWLAKLEDGFGLPAVLRIVRYEQSDIVAKRAAMTVIENLDLEQIDQIEMLTKAMEELPDAQRVPLKWLRAFHADVVAHQAFELDDDNKAAKARLQVWQELAQQENTLEDASRSTPSIREAINKRVAELAVSLLKVTSDEKPDALVLGIAENALEYLLENNKDDPSRIIDLGRWLIDAKQVSLFEDKVWKPFQELRETQPQYTYLGAEAFAESDPDRAQKLADEAFNIYETPPTIERQDKDDPDEEELAEDGELAEDEFDYVDPLVAVFAQINTAIALENRGLTEWAVREYRRLMENKNDHWRVSIIREQATIILSELLHDRGRDEEAADVLTTLTDKRANNVFGNDDLGDRVSVTSRMHYFRSEHYRKEADREKQIEFLRKAVQADSTDADVLIAMHRLPRADEKWKAETSRLIAKAVRGFEMKIERQKAAGEINNRAEVAKNLNQVAWLVGNTEGDFKKAIEQSRRSLELRPASPGSLDTLGRTYFAAGDVENALKYQRRAAKLEPHSKQIARQLAEFEMAASQGLRPNKGTEATPIKEGVAP